MVALIKVKSMCEGLLRWLKQTWELSKGSTSHKPSSSLEICLYHWGLELFVLSASLNSTVKPRDYAVEFVNHIFRLIPSYLIHHIPSYWARERERERALWSWLHTRRSLSAFCRTLSNSSFTMTPIERIYEVNSVPHKILQHDGLFG